MKHVTYFQNFLSNEVDLNKTRLDRLNDSSSAVNTFLSSNLDAYEKTERQGSLRFENNYQTGWDARV